MLAAIATSDLLHAYIGLASIVTGLALGCVVYGIALIGAPR